MTRLWAEGEPVVVAVDAQGRPLRFSWQGRLHRLHRIQQQWRVDSDWWDQEGRVWRDYFSVTTTNGLLCVLYYDLLQESWHLAKVYD